MHDSLGNRIKTFYEAIPRISLTRRLPMIIRIDGRAFHSLLRKAVKPFDQDFIEAMWTTAAAVCQEISGCMMAYAQSDEVSFLVRDDQTFDTQPWFGKDIQKMASVSASIASAHLTQIMGKIVTFDSRSFVLPKEEVTNYMIWRQQDASRNSISMACYAELGKKMGRKTSQKLMHGKNVDEQQELLFQECGINWNDYPTYLKRGVCIIKQSYEVNGAMRKRWGVDKDIPIFTQDREYIEKFLKDSND